MEPPKVTASLGAWSYGLGAHGVTEEQFAALKIMAGLTVAPEVLELNVLDNCACGHPESFHAPHLGCSGSHHDSVSCMNYAPVDPDVLSVNGRQHVLEMLDDDQA
jgi:hypothetical protein